MTKAADGAQAAQLHHDDTFDLIISDLAMPGLAELRDQVAALLAAIR